MFLGDECSKIQSEFKIDIKLYFLEKAYNLNPV
jgi:hypothetical protein